VGRTHPSRSRLGVDLGGSKIELIALAGNGSAVWRERVATPAGDYAATIATIVRLVARAEQRLGGQASVGIGMPGAISSRTGLVKNANSTVLNGKPFQPDVEQALRRAVRLQNDANCFAYSEAIDGAGRDVDSVFGVILGTGVGGGLVINRKLVLGATAIAGEWGHNPLPAIAQLGLLDEPARLSARLEMPGSACYCGRYGCVETWLSGPAFAADYERLLMQTGAAAAVTSNESNSKTDSVAIVAAMRAGNAIANAAFERYIDRLARALASVINIVDPQVIVLGGGMSKIAELYQRLPAALPRYVFSDELQTRILPPMHGDSSGVRGAAWLWD
jgi:fructokinase